MSWASKQWKRTKRQLKRVGKSLFGGISDAFRSLGDVITEGVKDIYDDVKDIYDDVVDIFIDPLLPESVKKVGREFNKFVKHPAVYGAALGFLTGLFWFGPLIGAYVGYQVGLAFSYRKGGNPYVAEALDLQWNSTQRNTPLYINYGRNLIAGSIIFIGRAETSVQTAGGGGKNFGSTSEPEVHSFQYYTEAAIGLCEGELVSIGRVWFNDREVTIFRDDAFTPYVGTNSQTANDYVMAAVNYDARSFWDVIKAGGTSVVEEEKAAPAWRNTAYVMFHGYTRHNIIPTVVVETNGAYLAVVRALDALGSGSGVGSSFEDDFEDGVFDTDLWDVTTGGKYATSGDYTASEYDGALRIALTPSETDGACYFIQTDDVYDLANGYVKALVEINFPAWEPSPPDAKYHFSVVMGVTDTLAEGTGDVIEATGDYVEGSGDIAELTIYAKNYDAYYHDYDKAMIEMSSIHGSYNFEPYVTPIHWMNIDDFLPPSGGVRENGWRFDLSCGYMVIGRNNIAASGDEVKFYYFDGFDFTEQLDNYGKIFGWNDVDINIDENGNIMRSACPAGAGYNHYSFGATSWQAMSTYSDWYYTYASDHFVVGMCSAYYGPAWEYSWNYAIYLTVITKTLTNNYRISTIDISPTEDWLRSQLVDICAPDDVGPPGYGVFGTTILAAQATNIFIVVYYKINHNEDGSTYVVDRSALFKYDYSTNAWSHIGWPANQVNRYDCFYINNYLSVSLQSDYPEICVWEGNILLCSRQALNLEETSWAYHVYFYNGFTWSTIDSTTVSSPILRHPFSRPAMKGSSMAYVKDEETLYHSSTGISFGIVDVGVDVSVNRIYNVKVSQDEIAVSVYTDEGNVELWYYGRTRTRTPSIIYDESLMLWLRFRHVSASNVLYIDTSPNNIDWVTRFTRDLTGSTWSPDKLRFYIGAKTDTPGAPVGNVAIHHVKWDKNVAVSDDSWIELIDVSDSKNNPAACLLDLLMNDRYGLGIPVDQIDTSSFAEVAAYCNEQVTVQTEITESRFEFDLVIHTSAPAIDWIHEILATFAGYLHISVGKLKLIVDKPLSWSDYNACTRFTVNNIVANSFAYAMKSGTERFNKILLEFINREDYLYDDTVASYKKDGGLSITDWVQKSKDALKSKTGQLSPAETGPPYRHDYVVAENAYSQDLYGVREKTIRLYGIKRKSQAQRMAQYYLEQCQYSTYSCEFRIDFSNCAVEVGDVIWVSHPDTPWYYEWGGQYFRIVAITEEEDFTYKISCIQHIYGWSDDNNTTSYQVSRAYNPAMFAYRTPEQIIYLNAYDTGKKILLTYTLQDNAGPFSYTMFYKKVGDGDYVTLGKQSAVSAAAYLKDTINDSIQTIDLVRLGGSWQNSGTVYIDNEQIKYAELSGDSQLKQCTRGANSTDNTPHNYYKSLLSVDKVYIGNPGSLEDRTTEFTSAEETQQFFGGSGDWLYIGTESRFGRVDFTLDVPASPAVQISGDYAVGSGDWNELEFTDTTSGFTQDGCMVWDIWQQSRWSFNSAIIGEQLIDSGDTTIRYYVRFKRTNTFDVEDTAPVESTIVLCTPTIVSDITKSQYYEYEYLDSEVGQILTFKAVAVSSFNIASEATEAPTVTIIPSG